MLGAPVRRVGELVIVVGGCVGSLGLPVVEVVGPTVGAPSEGEKLAGGSVGLAVSVPEPVVTMVTVSVGLVVFDLPRDGLTDGFPVFGLSVAAT